MNLGEAGVFLKTFRGLIILHNLLKFLSGRLWAKKVIQFWKWFWKTTACFWQQPKVAKSAEMKTKCQKIDKILNRNLWQDNHLWINQWTLNNFKPGSNIHMVFGIGKPFSLYRTFTWSNCRNFSSEPYCAVWGCYWVARGCLGCAVVGATQIKCWDPKESKSMAGMLKKFILCSVF